MSIAMFVGCLGEQGVHDTSEKGDADAAPETDTADAEDTGADVPDSTEVDTIESVQCEAHEACNALLDEAGRCPGTCFAVRAPFRCEGVVRLGVCHAITPIDPPNETLDFPLFTVHFDVVPELAKIGEVHPLALTVVNTSGAPLTLPLRWKNPQTWLIEDATWDGVDEVTFAIGEARSFTATITAQRQTVFAAGGDIIVSLAFGDPRATGDERPEWVVEPRANVVFGDDQPIACGGFHFPETWCDGECVGSGIYQSAKCCGDAFFPGVSCCSDDDCEGATCAEGKCVDRVPWLSSANGLPLGKLRVRMVLVDTHPQFVDPCENHYEDLKDDIDFATIERWYAELAQRRFGGPTMEIQWVVTGGVETSDFLTGATHWDNYSKELDAWLGDRGCPILDRYDKLIVSASTMDFWGYGGLYFDRGHMAIMSPYNAYLTTHELAHSFGARDLYLDLGGVLTYPSELMGNSLNGEPGDAVAWAEMGYGDLDRNGVLDIAEHAAMPTRLEVANATATLTRKDTIELRWEFVGIEDGVAKRVVVPKFQFAWTLANMDVEWHYAGRWKTMVIDSTMVDFAAVRAAGEVTVTLGTRHVYTGPDWQPVELVLDTPMTVPLTIE